MLLTIRCAVPEDEPSVVELWRACDLVASYNDPAADFRFARAGACSEVLVCEDEAGHISGSVMVGMTVTGAGCIMSLRHLTRATAGSVDRWCRQQRSGCANEV